MPKIISIAATSSSKLPATCGGIVKRKPMTSNPTMNNVKWGEGTGDEMCLTGVYFTLAD